MMGYLFGMSKFTAERVLQCRGDHIQPTRLHPHRAQPMLVWKASFLGIYFASDLLSRWRKSEHLSSIYQPQSVKSSQMPAHYAKAEFRQPPWYYQKALEIQNQAEIFSVFKCHCSSLGPHTSQMRLMTVWSRSSASR